ncbi:hypothetical protein ColTof4_01319 [Colletotrichum tofieldiae]|nr:hypothetical protein ColTof3_08571 [Colletotrichum tofieldiae]GKT68896.1 hypothetical protein ColTof4_01319 [Colletotrichum tofieldiae]
MQQSTTPTYDIVYSKLGLQRLVGEVEKTLVQEERMVVEGAPELYKYKWDEKYHRWFVREVLQYKDSTTIETLADSDDSEGSNSAQRYDISYHIRKKMKRSGLRSPKGSGQYHPLLLSLESGIQWFEEKQMAVIVLIRVDGGDTAKVEILARNGETTETVMSTLTLSVGCVILIYGPHGWRLQGQAVSFLFLYYDVVNREAGVTPGS